MQFRYFFSSLVDVSMDSGLNFNSEDEVFFFVIVVFNREYSILRELFLEDPLICFCHDGLISD